MKVEVVDYRKSLYMQRRAVEKIQSGEGSEVLMILSHPPTITLGRKGNFGNVLVPPGSLAEMGIDVIRTERGGDVTFHCPGQIVAYPVFDLVSRRLSPPRHVWNLEEAMIATLAEIGVESSRSDGMRGVFVRDGNGRPAKIGAVGVAVARGVSFHGLALNVRVDTKEFDVIVPCGLKQFNVTSMHIELGEPPRIDGVADILVKKMRQIYGGGFEVVSEF